MIVSIPYRVINYTYRLQSGLKTMSILGKRLLALRKEKGFSQEELAELIGTSQKQVSKYETGKNDPTGMVLHNMAAALNTTTDYLLGRTEIKEPPLRGEGDLEKSETELIRLLRQQDPETRQRIYNAIKALVPEGA